MTTKSNETKNIFKQNKVTTLPTSPKEPAGGSTKANNISHSDTEKRHTAEAAKPITQRKDD